MTLNQTLKQCVGRGAMLSLVVTLAACAPTQATNQSKFTSWLPGMQPDKPKSTSSTPTPPPVANTPRRTTPPQQLGALPRNPAASAPSGSSNQPSSGNLQSVLTQADQSYRNGALAQAEQAYRRAINMDPRQPIAHYRLGNIAFRKGQFPQAAQHFQRAVELSPRNAKAHYNLGVVYLTLVEKHFKHYRATMPADADTAKIAQLLQHIDAFASGRNNTAQRTPQNKDSLDALAEALE